ncbi:MAG: hypothetical protein JNM55_16375 [Anaerolineales bacterium]|nr:hypothetical protein [Anaerolineales bacterium]
MKDHSSSMNRKPIWLLIVVSVGFALFGMVCSKAWNIFPTETRAPYSFPNTDLVFSSNKGIGFVNADGTNLNYFPLTAKLPYGMENAAWRPVITGDNRTLIVKMSDRFMFVFEPHILVVWNTGELPVPCLQWQNQQMAYLTTDQKQIFIATKNGLALYDLNTCGKDTAPSTIYESISGIPSPNLQYTVRTNRPSVIGDDDRFIVVRKLDGDQEQTIGVGDYPVWSRDSQQLAYIGRDGIYVYNVLEDSKPRLVVHYKNPYPYHESNALYEGGDSARVPPEISWSSDGVWLAYHKWQGTSSSSGNDPAYNTIYKLNIKTGEEIKVVDGGMYPNWRWPAE